MINWLLLLASVTLSLALAIGGTIVSMVDAIFGVIQLIFEDSTLF